MLLIALVVTSGQRFWEVIFFLSVISSRDWGRMRCDLTKGVLELYSDLALKWSPYILGYSPSFNVFSFFNFLRQRCQNWSNHCKRVLHQDSLTLSKMILQLWLLLLILIRDVVSYILHLCLLPRSYCTAEQRWVCTACTYCVAFIRATTLEPWWPDRKQDTAELVPGIAKPNADCSSCVSQASVITTGPDSRALWSLLFLGIQEQELC